jgi:hypothetical protein
MIVAWHEVPGTWNSANPKPSRRVRYDSCRYAHRFDMAPISTRNTSGIGCADHTVPYGTALSRDTFPGTSCLATIMLSLWDNIHSSRRGFD